MSISKGGQRQSQTGTTNIDDQTQQRLKQMWDAAQSAGAAGPSPLVGGATDYNSGLMKAGATGAAALGGDASATQQLMNPYQQQVIDAMRAQAGVTNQQGMNTISDAATRAGAFGGSRQGVATGTMLAQNSRDLNSNIGGLLSTGFDNAMTRAANSAGLGFNAAGANANLGMGGVGSPQQWLLNMLNQAYKGPMGSTSSGTTTGTYAGAQFDPLKLFASAMGGGGGGS